MCGLLNYRKISELNQIAKEGEVKIYLYIYLFDIVQRQNRQSTCEKPQQTPRGLAVACQHQPEAVHEAVLFLWCPHHVQIDVTRSGAHDGTEITPTDHIHKSKDEPSNSPGCSASLSRAAIWLW